MATSRHFGVKNTTSNFNFVGYTEIGYLVIMENPADHNSLGSYPGGPSNPSIRWYIGPDEDTHPHYIAYTNINVLGYPIEFGTEGDQGDDETPGTNSAGIAFKRFDGTNAGFLEAANSIHPGIIFDTATEASIWLDENSCWTSYSISPE